MKGVSFQWITNHMLLISQTQNKETKLELVLISCEDI
jgi:hypothetical protein